MSATTARPHDAIDDAYARWARDLQRVDALTKLFVVGTAKSGTTWVQRLLNNHPRVVVDGEGGFAWRTLPLLRQVASAHNRDCATHGHPEHVRYTERELVLHFRHLVLAKFALYVERAGRDAGDLDAIGDKTPQHALGLGALATAFPDARFVHVVRDPRDGAVSAWFHFGASSGRTFEQHVHWYIAESWRQTIEGVMRHGAQLGASLLHLRYEDLHADPIARCADLLEHCRVDHDNATVRACVDDASFERVSGGRSRGDEDNSQFMRKGVVGDWREKIDEALAREACAPVAALMERFHYDA
jgi:hypothetical protein